MEPRDRLADAVTPTTEDQSGPFYTTAADRCQNFNANKYFSSSETRNVVDFNDFLTQKGTFSFFILKKKI